MQNIINIVVFMLVLGSIITIHEFGHFITAKMFGVYCSNFSIGFGPKLFSYKGKETSYELRLWPIGGFVAMAGEEDQLENEALKDIPVERTIKGLAVYKRIIIFAAGVIMNFILAIAVLFCLNMTVGEIGVNQAQVGEIFENSPAEVYGLNENDIITQIYIEDIDKTILVSKFEDINLSRDHLGVNSTQLNVSVNVLRNDKNVTIDMVLDYEQEGNRYVMGINQATRDMTFVESIQYTFVVFKDMSTSIIDALSQLITSFSSTITQMSGPAGIYQITAEVTESGQIASIFELLAMLSINIGIFNLLPIPGLDGCQILFAAVEGMIGKELPHKLKIILQVCGLVLVFGLMIIVTFQDLLRIFG